MHARVQRHRRAADDVPEFEVIVSVDEVDQRHGTSRAVEPVGEEGALQAGGGLGEDDGVYVSENSHQQLATTYLANVVLMSSHCHTQALRSLSTPNAYTHRCRTSFSRQLVEDLCVHKMRRDMAISSWLNQLLTYGRPETMMCGLLSPAETRWSV